MSAKVQLTEYSPEEIRGAIAFHQQIQSQIQFTTCEKIAKIFVKVVVLGLALLLGSILGSFLGGLLGSAVPIPILGTTLGVVLGAAIGGAIAFTIALTALEKFDNYMQNRAINRFLASQELKNEAS